MWIYCDLIAFPWAAPKQELVFNMPWPAGRSHKPGQVLLWFSSFLTRAEQGSHSNAVSTCETGTVCMATRLQIQAVCQTHRYVWAETAEKETAVLLSPCFLLRKWPSSGSPDFGPNQNQLSVSLDMKRQTDFLVDKWFGGTSQWPFPAGKLNVNYFFSFFSLISIGLKNVTDHAEDPDRTPNARISSKANSAALQTCHGCDNPNTLSDYHRVVVQSVGCKALSSPPQIFSVSGN